MLESAEQAIVSVSGVNLDEEAANLLRFQQAYQASAQIIQMSSKLFDSILGIR
ncbi:MAG: flagellar basal body rod C-terminal domain-containing protein [Porticoccaceae bacterium]